MGITNGVCDECGSGVLNDDLNQHIRNDLPCPDNPLTSEFWWENHRRLVREGRLSQPFPRNPNDIRQAMSMTEAGRKAIMDAHMAGQCYRNISQYDAGYEVVISTAIARLLDAGVLRRGPQS